MLPSVAIVGRPNVGKSTIFNRLLGERKAITDDQPGVTRDRIYAKTSWLGRSFSIIDTGGIEISNAPFLTEIRAQVEIALEESQVVVFVVDAKTGLIGDDFEVMRLLYSCGKPVIIAANKSDNQKTAENIYDFYQLGATDVVAVSGAHGIGIGDLLDKIIAFLPDEIDEPYQENDIKIAIIGRPNVGKSSLTNAILGNERVIVSDIQGTTTDAIDTVIEKDGQQYVVIDTAGLRKRGKIFESVDKYAALRSMQAIERSDVCLMILDAVTGIQEQDKHIAGYALEAGKAMIIVVNKWDGIQKDDHTMNEWTENLRIEFQFLTYIPIVFLSALTKARLKTLFPSIKQSYDNYVKRISTSALNEVISEAMEINPPKEHNQNKVKVYYATQVASKCPTFVLFVNDTNCMHFSYYRYLENRLRERFDFFGTPIKMILRKRD
ncbi:MAG: ribosome biogenesis GTPase Der [bacterium]|jgi:GTP-binding protein|nr:ribosome biogenesis GTPase Der [bacterium]